MNGGGPGPTGSWGAYCVINGGLEGSGSFADVADGGTSPIPRTMLLGPGRLCTGTIYK